MADRVKKKPAPLSSNAIQLRISGLMLRGLLLRASCLSGVFENQDAVVVQVDFLGLPCLALVEAIGVGIRWIP